MEGLLHEIGLIYNKRMDIAVFNEGEKPGYPKERALPWVVLRPMTIGLVKGMWKEAISQPGPTKAILLLVVHQVTGITLTNI